MLDPMSVTNGVPKSMSFVPFVGDEANLRPEFVRGGGSMYLQLSQCESTSSSNTAVVLDSWASDNRSEEVNGTRCDLCGLGGASVSSRDLLAGLYFQNVRSRSCIITNQPIVKFPLHSIISSLYWVSINRSVPGRSGIEHGVASPFGSLRFSQYSCGPPWFSVFVAAGASSFLFGRAN